LRGCHFWVILPASAKMTEPCYQEFGSERIPVAQVGPGVIEKVIAGEVTDRDGATVRGPIDQPATSPIYLDVALEPGARWQYALPSGHNAFAYVFEGDASIGAGEDARALDRHELGVLGGGDDVVLEGGKDGARL